MEDTVMNDTVSGDLAVGNGHQLPPGPTSPRNWILYLPPEIRLLIYRFVVQLADDIPYHLRFSWRSPGMETLAGILHTSRLIRRESINVFFQVNVFTVNPWFMKMFPTFTVTPSRQISQMIQNLTIEVRVSAIPQQPQPREEFMDVINTFGDPRFIRGTLRVQFCVYLPPDDIVRQSPQRFFIRGLRRFTNFQIVQIDLSYHGSPVLNTAAMDYDYIENALHFFLGPARTRTIGQSMIFFPRQFLSTQQVQENFDHDGAIRLGWHGDQTDASQTAGQIADQDTKLER
ncbi:hypothetical protein MMC07_001146 [Pseudocyphellaria aurata]|nr:hypothetical protein [Pseudocyphellaria aurata]